MKHFFTCIALFSTLCLAAQNAELTGSVTNQATNEPISGASIKYDKGKGVITDANGRYRISLAEGQYDLSITSIGYKRQKQSITVAAGEKQTLNFQLKTDAYEFHEIVSVSQYKKNAAKENVSVEVVSAEQIKHTNSQDLGEALGKSSGVLVQDGQITIRGGSGYSYGVGSRTAVLQDGLSLMSADLGQGQNTMASLSNAKQIEVIKGASSVIYGSSALNGVVNVVTSWPVEDTPTTTLDVNTGVYGNTPKNYQIWWGNALPFFINANVNHRRKIDNIQIVTGGNITGIYSYLQANNNWRAQAFLKTRVLSKKVEGLNYGVDISAQYETIDEFFIGKNSDSAAYKVGAGSSSRYMRFNLDPHLTYSTAKGHTYNLKMRYMNIDRIANGNDPDAVSHQIMVDNQYQYKWRNMFISTTGAPITMGVSRSNLYNQTHITLSAAIYSQLEFNYKGLSAQAGIRYEVQKVDNDVQTSSPIFRAGINYEASKSTHIRASWGQAYRIPTIGERDILQNFTTGILVIPNDTLRVERGWSAELGINQVFKIGKNFIGFVDLAVYYNRYFNFTQYDFGQYKNRFPGSGKIITTDSALLNTIIPYFNPIKGVNPDGTIIPATGVPLNQITLFGIQAHNIENAQIFGYEFSLGGRGQIGPVGITFNAGYSYNYGSSIPTSGDTSDHYTTDKFFRDAFKYNIQRLTDTTSESYRHALAYRVRHLLRADIELKYWRCYIGTTLSYGSLPEVVPATITTAINYIAGDKGVSYDKYRAEHEGGDFIADIRMGYRVNNHFEMGFIVKNVGNRFYMLRPGKPEPIRNYTIQFRYSF